MTAAQASGNGRVTDEQATAALYTLTGTADPDAPVMVTQEAEAPVPDDATVDETAGGDTTDTEPAETDDVASLKQRLGDMEARLVKDAEGAKARLAAVQGRYTQTEQILRDRYLRKSAAADNALKILRSARTESGVAETDVDRVIREMESTMNPASASYVPPESQGGAAATEEQAIVLNNFLNEQGMTSDEADSFGKWVRTEASTAMSPAEQAVAAQSLDGFLRLAHRRYAESTSDAAKQTKRDDVIGVVRSVQQTQRQAIRAGAASATAPRKQPTGSRTGVDLKQLKPDDISTLLQQSASQYR